jgi:hypothetical protein
MVSAAAGDLNCSTAPAVAPAGHVVAGVFYPTGVHHDVRPLFSYCRCLLLLVDSFIHSCYLTSCIQWLLHAVQLWMYLCRYYYNKWMTQRMHVALLELHLGCSLGSGTSQQLLEAAAAAADEPAIAAAAAAAGFTTTSAAATAAAAPAALPGSEMDEDSFNNSSGSKSNATTESAAGKQLVPQQHQQQQSLQLPELVVSKLLSLDAGDLDLLIQHPAALQAQVCWGA